MISFIVPAHSEEAWIGRCVSAIRSGAEFLGESHEIIVVDDASSDATASIARQQGAGDSGEAPVDCRHSQCRCAAGSR